MRTLVLGVGSSILSDDTVGLHVVRRLRERLGNREDIVFGENEEGGFSLLDDSVGYDRLILIDSIMLGDEPGALTRFNLADLGPTIHSTSPHGMNLATVMELGRRQGLDVPREVLIFAVEVRDVTTFGEEPTPEIASRVDAIADEIAAELSRRGSEAQ